MPLSWEQIQANALYFSKKWDERAGKEKQQAQMFVHDFLECFGIKDPLQIGEYEHKAKKELGYDGYIDYFSPERIIIEMKTKGEDLKKADKQIKDYVLHLPSHEMPSLIMICDFEKIILTHRISGKQKIFKTKELHKHIKEFAHIAGYETTRTYEDEIDVNIKAAEKMALLHDAIKNYGYEGHQLEVYLVRLLFCLFAEDTGIFQKTSFRNFVDNSEKDGSDLSMRLSKLFEVLNLSDELRKKRTNLPSELTIFRYINGGLFADMLPTPDFDTKMRKTLLDCCAFDWSKISPAIFGAMFQGVMDKKQRRELGAHYTSEENILKLIKPLFLDELWEEFHKVKSTPQLLEQFHTKLANLKFLDPACGCGNFLIITYKELRVLEINVLKMKVTTGQKFLSLDSLLKVTVEQFYGIEYEEFPCQIAQVGMWLMDHQMNVKVAEEFGEYFARLPLTQSATIKHANALTFDWEELISKDKLSYIIGNPPFIGYGLMSNEQKIDVLSIYIDENGKPYKTAGKIDYVSCWYYKSAQFMQNTFIRTALVSTNSITQGEQVVAVWKPLFDQFKIHIDFAYKTFKWNNEAKGKAAVHCVIVGFSTAHSNNSKIIFDEQGRYNKVKNINGYLVEAPNVFIHSRSKPICDIPQMTTGNRPADGGNLIIEAEDYEDFIRKEPQAVKYIKRLTGAEEFINNKMRYCLWLVDASPSDIKTMPEILKRIEACRQDRMQGAPDRQKLADTPMLFRETKNPNTAILIPRVSSERRPYIPLGFIDNSVIVTDSAVYIPNATPYHFGILTSNVHNGWMRTVCGRLKSDYRYSKDIVYNNFPWPEADDKQKENIEKLAQEVLDARNLFPDSSLADLYDPIIMPIELRKAHQKLDTAVMKLYGYSSKMTEADIVADLLQRYQKLVG